MWIDSHCHLDHEKIRPLGSPEALVSRARDAGVVGALTVCCRISDEFPAVVRLANDYKNVWCSIGTHPHEASDPAEKEVTEDRLAALALSDPRIVAIGETGLDYYYNNSLAEDQRGSFRKHLRACRATGLPVIVHAREADDDIARMLREESGGGALRGVMHCFSSAPALAAAALDLGFFISFSGILTFKKAEVLRDVARSVPLGRLLVETDSPYLAPEPVRARVNEPANLIHTGRFLADLRGVSESEMAQRTHQNFFTLFDRARAEAV